MIIVILIIAVLVCLFGVWVSDNTMDDGFFSFLLGGAMFVVSIVTAIILIINVSSLSVIDDKIAMYQEENDKIETQIETVVKQYQEYETDIFTGVTTDSAITLVSLYPELKSDTLVQSQIDIYVKNNEKIKELKEKNINGSVYRWWLYFGK